MWRGKDNTRRSRRGWTVAEEVHQSLEFQLIPNHKQQAEKSMCCVWVDGGPSSIAKLKRLFFSCNSANGAGSVQPPTTHCKTHPPAHLPSEFSSWALLSWTLLSIHLHFVFYAVMLCWLWSFAPGKEDTMLLWTLFIFIVFSQQC